MAPPMESTTEPIATTFLGSCATCQAVWVVATFLDVRHELIAAQLPRHCPLCYRPLALTDHPRREPDAKPC